MSLDFDLDDEQRAMADAVAVYCRDQASPDAIRAAVDDFPKTLWEGLAELGVLGIATQEGGGGALEVVASMEELGRANFPGPLVASFVAGRLLAEAERESVARGEAIVSLGAPPLLPWAPFATIFIELAGKRAFRARPAGRVERVDTLGGEPWGRVGLIRGEEFESADTALALGDVAAAAYLAAAGQRLIDAASTHARDRKQFGRALGDFQAVAHPLAQSAMGLAAAAALTRVAAFAIDNQLEDAAHRAACARYSAGRAALEAAYTTPQTFGGLGVMEDGEVFPLARRIRQLVSIPPGDAIARESALAQFGLS